MLPSITLEEFFYSNEKIQIDSPTYIDFTIKECENRSIQNYIIKHPNEYKTWKQEGRLIIHDRDGGIHYVWGNPTHTLNLSPQRKWEL